MENQEKKKALDEKIKKTIRQQYVNVALVTIGIAAAAIGIGYLIDQWQGTQPRYMLIGLVISAPATVWINFGTLKRKLIALNKEMEDVSKDVER